MDNYTVKKNILVIDDSPSYLRMTAEIPVVFLTSSDDKETVLSLLALKPKGYLLKNQPQSIIMERIRKFLDGGEY